MRKLSGNLDTKKCWREIEKILGEEAPVEPAPSIIIIVMSDTMIHFSKGNNDE